MVRADIALKVSLRGGTFRVVLETKALLRYRELSPAEFIPRNKWTYSSPIEVRRRQPGKALEQCNVLAMS